MTPYLTFRQSVKVSSITMGALEDLGYSVNRTEEDAFGLGDLGICGDFCPAAGRRRRKMLRSRSNSTTISLPVEDIPPHPMPLSEQAELSLLEAAVERFRGRPKPATQQVQATQGVTTDGTVVSYVYQENGKFMSRTIHSSQVGRTSHLIINYFFINKIFLRIH